MAPVTRAKKEERHTSHTSSKHSFTSGVNTKSVSAIRHKAIKKQTFQPQVATRSKLNKISQSLNKAIESNNLIDTFKLALELQKHPESVCQKTLNKALLSACSTGNKILVQSLLLCNVDVNCKDVSGNTPLMICAMKGFCVIAQILVQRGADINHVNNKADTALILSITNSGLTDMVKLLLDQDTIDIFHKNLEGSTCLSKAVQSLDFEVVKIILNKAHSIYFRGGKYIRYPQFILQGQTMATRLGLHTIFMYIEKEISEHRSALLSAVSASDFESINFLLNYLSANELRKGCTHDSLIVLILDCYEERSTGITDIDVEIVRKIILSIQTFKHYHYREREILSKAVNIGNCELLGLLCQYVNKYERELEDIYNKAYYRGVAAVIERNDFDSLQVLLQYRPDLMYICERKNTLINNALRKGAAYFLEIYLSQERQLDVAESLLNSIQHSQTIIFDLIIEKLNEKAISAIRDNILRFFNIAVKVGNKDIITALLGLGADVNGICREETPLMCCKTPEIGLIMLENGADINAHVGSKKSSALLNLFSQHLYIGATPVFEGNVLIMKSNSDILLDLVSFYIKHGANIEDKDYYGQTPVMLASKFGQYEKVLKFLLDSGANPNNFDNNGKTALHFAVSKRYLQDVHILLNFKADVNAQCHCGESPLHLATEVGDNIIIKTLIESGGNINIEDIKGNIPFFKAIQQRNIEAIKYLIEIGSNIKHLNKDGTSALMIAAKHHCTEIVPLLCDNGVLINLRSHVDGNNAVDIILESTLCGFSITEAIKCTEYLLQNGGSAANVKDTIVLRLISLGKCGLLQKLMNAGLSPTECAREKFSHNIKKFIIGPTISPFCYALLLNRTKIAQYFIDISFLTAADINDKQRIGKYYAHFFNFHYQNALNVLDEILYKPMSLERLCLVTVSSAVGTGIHREEKITRLPLPATFKDQLMFRTQSMLKYDDESDETDLHSGSIFIDHFYDSDEESGDYGYNFPYDNFHYDSSDS